MPVIIRVPVSRNQQLRTCVTCFIFSKGDDELAMGTDQPWEGTGRGTAQAKILLLPFPGFSIFLQSHKSTRRKMKPYVLGIHISTLQNTFSPKTRDA